MAATLFAQPGEFRAWNPPADDPRVAPQVACQDLRAATNYEFSILSATLEPATAATPAYCRVMGFIAPEIRFEVALPASWNLRLAMIGNGGFAGEPLDAPGRRATREAALAKGFAFTQTNTGHDAAVEPLGTFAVTPQKVVDYAFRAVHLTAVSAKAIANLYYARPVARAYFMGCSTGGRQALISAQRFPADFDGIVAGAPVLDFTGTMLNYADIFQAFARGPLTAAKVKLAGESIYARCDAKDGLADGLLADPRGCGFSPAEHLPKCAEGAADTAGCFTADEIRSLQALYKVYAPGPEIAVGPNSPLTGWSNWFIPANPGSPLVAVAFGETFFRYFVPTKPDPAFTLAQVDRAKLAPAIATLSRLLDATDADLSAFRRRNGKLLMWYGLADPALSPYMGIDYYEAALKQNGPGTREFFRFFLMPGVYHCAGGPGCDTAPRLAALIDWVERGRAPDRIEASRTVDQKVVRTRPLCPYPQVARYQGSGSIDEAANFTCAAP